MFRDHAVAIHWKYAIAIDDNRALREVGAQLEVVRTVDVILILIRAGA